MPGISDFLRPIVASELRGESDAELLGRFVANRDEAAFTAIVRRHGAMVYRVCRSVLWNEADAEDASQATFLVLAQKAAQVRKRGSLSSWLHGVAWRTSRKLRASIARRRASEAQLPPPPPANPDDLSVREARMLLHEELERLPARYKLKVPDGHYLTDVSPDGKWFLTMKYTDPKKKETGVYRMEYSSGKVSKLIDAGIVNLPSDWRISPDGRRVAGTKWADGRTWFSPLVVGDVTEGTLRQVKCEDHPEQFYGWSPEGRKLLCSFIRQPVQPKVGDAFHQIIAAIDADGSNRVEFYDCEGHYQPYGGTPVRVTNDMIDWADWR